MQVSNSFLRRVLKIDGITSAISGLALIFAAGPLSEALRLSTAFLIGTGVVLLPFAAFVLYVATRPMIGRGAVWTIVGLNVLWVVDSLLILMTNWIQPNAAGVAVVVIQAIGVAVLAELEYVGVRRVTAVAQAI